MENENVTKGGRHVAITSLARHSRGRKGFSSS